MQIIQGKTRKENLIDQFKEDLTALGKADLFTATYDQVTVEGMKAIPGAPADTGNDTDVQPNTEVTLKYKDSSEQDQTTTFKYRRLSITHLATKLGIVNDNTVQFDALEHDDSLAPVALTVAASKAVKAKLSTPSDAEFNASLSFNYPVKGTAEVSFKPADEELLYVGNFEATVRTRATDVGQYQEGGVVKYFKVGQITAPQEAIATVILPVDMTEIPAGLFDSQPHFSETTFQTAKDTITIGNGAFSGTRTTLDGFDFSKVTAVGNGAFTGAETTDFTLPETITSFGLGAFGQVTNFSFAGNAKRAVQVLGSQPATGATYKYTSTESISDPSVTLTYGDQNDTVVLKESEMEKTLFEDQEDFLASIKKVVFSGAVTTSPSAFENAAVEKVDMKLVETVDGEDCFKAATINELEVGADFSAHEQAFKGATIEAIRVPTKAKAIEMKAKDTYQMPHLTKNPKWLLPGSEDEINFGPSPSIPNTVTSSGFTYD